MCGAEAQTSSLIRESCHFRFFADGLISQGFVIVTVAKNPDQQRSAFSCFSRVHRRRIGEGLFTTVEGSTTAQINTSQVECLITVSRQQSGEQALLCDTCRLRFRCGL